MKSKTTMANGETPRIRTVVAPNPSMMTQNGTNSYIVGSGQVAVIDPGPAIEGHLGAILAALQPSESISHIFVTHAHKDHSGLTARLAAATGAKVYAFGTAKAGRSARMQNLIGTLALGGGEGVDHDFKPDVPLVDGDQIVADMWSLRAIHTPGHMGNHLCFASGTTLFTGDHVMGWSTSLISPPDGDMSDYMASLQKLAATHWDIFLPGHGEAVPNPAQRLAELVAHRHLREGSILAALDSGAQDIASLASVVYPELNVRLLPAAHRNLLAHLIDLERRKLVEAIPHLGPDALFKRL